MSGGRLAALLDPWLCGLRSRARPRPVHYLEDSGEYESTQVFRGFPVGGIGSGGLGIGTAGGFCDWRGNNNWMRPLSVLKGSFLALSTARSARPRDTRILRLGVPGGAAAEYEGARPPGSTRFVGELPSFTLSYPDLYPLRVTLAGFTPLVPHDVEASSLPLVLLTTTLTSACDEPVHASLAFSLENVLGRGGTGQTGVKLQRGIVPRLRGRLRYDDATHNRQDIVRHAGLAGLSFISDLAVDPRSHQQSTLGELLLLVDDDAGDLALSYARSWDAARPRSAMLDELARSGRLSVCEARPLKPAGAVCAQLTLAPREERTLHWVLAWWTPDHVTEEDPTAARQRHRHAGTRVGHAYAARAAGLGELVTQAHAQRTRLEQQSQGPRALLERTTLPAWLQRSLLAATSTALTNTVLPEDGRLYTLEATDWGWPFGGLCGTNDQRLSAHPYLQSFFPALDESELETFARHTRDGEVPHGIGNCDLGLDTDQVPYGRPLAFKPLLLQEPWPDLTLSWILQAYRSCTQRGDDDLLARNWQKVKEMVAFLERRSRHGVPEGGSTYDTFRFPGTFSYTATLAYAAYRALADAAARIDPSYAPYVTALAAAARARIDEALWDERGFFRTSPGRDTLFFGSLAGEWMARRSGLGSLLPTARVRAHLALAHAVLVEKRRQGIHARLDRAAFIHSEAAPSGKPRRMFIGGLEVFAYAWQALSYHGLLAIHAGLVEEGLATLRVIYERVFSGGYPWSADLYGNPGAIYMTSAAWWALPDALTGACFRAHEGVLQLAPRPLPGGPDRQVLPIIQPRFWGLLELDRTKDDLVLHVTTTFREPPILREVRNVDDDSVLWRGELALAAGLRLQLPLTSLGVTRASLRS